MGCAAAPNANDSLLLIARVTVEGRFLRPRSARLGLWEGMAEAEAEVSVNVDAEGRPARLSAPRPELRDDRALGTVPHVDTSEGSGEDALLRVLRDASRGARCAAADIVRARSCGLCNPVAVRLRLERLADAESAFDAFLTSLSESLVLVLSRPVRTLVPTVVAIEDVDSFQGIECLNAVRTCPHVISAVSSSPEDTANARAAASTVRG